MSRLPDFRKTVYLGMNAKGETMLLPEITGIAVWEFCVKNEIKKISPPYKIQAGGGIKITVKTPKSAPTPTISKPKGVRAAQGKPDALPKVSEAGSTKHREPKKGKAEFYCKSCEKDVDNPKSTPNGKVQCPHCLRVNTITGKEE